MSEKTITESAHASSLKNPFFAMDTCTRGTDEARLDLLKDTGYTGTNWGLCDPPALQHAFDTARSRGIRMFAVYCGAELRRDGLHIDPRVDAVLTILHGTDALIWLNITSPDFPVSSPEGDAIAVKGLHELSASAAKHRLRIALYPHTGMWLERVQDAVRIASAVDRKNLGVTFNLCHCLMVGDESHIPDLLALAAPRLFAVTINGADTGAARTGWDRLIQPLDKGTFALAPLLKTLVHIKYRGPIGLQGYGLQGEDRDNLTRSMAAWRAL